MNQVFASGGQSTGASTSASVLPVNIQGWFPSALTGFDLLGIQGTPQSLLWHHSLRASICDQLSLWSNSHLHTCLLEKSALTIQTFVGKVISLLFDTLPRLITALLPRSKCLLISWLKLLSAVILESKKIKSITVSIVSPSICHEVMGPDAIILVFWMLSFKPPFSFFFFTFIKRLFSSSSPSAIRVESSAYRSLLLFLLAISVSACDSSSPARRLDKNLPNV